VNYLGDRLNQGNVAAANNVTNWSGTCYVTPLIGAFLADSYLGRYWTIASFVIIYIIVSFALKVNQISSTLDQCLWLSVCIESSLVSVYACLFISSHSRISSAKSLSWFSPFQDIL